MDKKYFILGMVCLMVAFGLMFKESHENQRAILSKPSENITQGPIISQNVPSLDKLTETSEKRTIAGEGDIFRKISAPAVAKSEEKSAIKENIFVLENDNIRVSFTDLGGSIKAVDLKKFPAELNSKDTYIFNEKASESALAISLGSGNSGTFPIVHKPKYEVVSKTNSSIQFSYTTVDGMNIVRGYKLQGSGKQEDPYVILHETKFANNTEHAFDLSHLLINLGTIRPTVSDQMGDYLNFGYFEHEKSYFIKARDFHASNGIFGMGRKPSQDIIQESRKSIVWGAIKNQFFTAVLTPENIANGFSAKPAVIDLKNKEEGICGHMEFDLGILLPKKEVIVPMSYYVGPKEYVRLSKLGQNQDQIMEFGFFGAISKLLLLMMLGIHSFVSNWGLTIIIVTAIVKLVLWPLTAAQVRSSKRMGQIQQPLKELREKFKDNPQKLQAETMRLFKENKVNPAAGCLPLLIQLPLFIGLYYMLRTSSEMRFESFLWIKDLSVSDTVGHLAGMPVNILPILMTITMLLQMSLSPTPTMDATQQKIMKFTPVLFLFFCYSLPSALILYWTVQNIFTILQQLLTQKRILANDQLMTQSQTQAQKQKKKSHFVKSK